MGEGQTRVFAQSRHAGRPLQAMLMNTESIESIKTCDV